MIKIGIVLVGFVCATACSVPDAIESSAANGDAVDDDHPDWRTVDTCADHADELEPPGLRDLAAQRVEWHEATRARSHTVHLKLLGFNDFHGQLSTGKLVAGRPVGGAAVMAAYLRSLGAGFEGRSLIIHAGDMVGASPPASALLQDEPSIAFLNLLGNTSCSYLFRYHPACNIVGTLGNHEFDEGKQEMLRLVFGGDHPSGPFLDTPYRGARFPYVSSNVVSADSGQPILPPFVIKIIGGVPVGVIGAVLRETPTIVTPSGVAGLNFLDEATAINGWARLLRFLGVKTIIVTIHQGGVQTAFVGPTAPTGTVTGRIAEIVSQLDDEVDVVISGHTHAFTNALIPNQHGRMILVTQSFSASTAVTDIDLEVDAHTGDVISKSARVVTTFADVAPGNAPAADVAALVAAAETRVAPLVNQVIGDAAVAMTRTQNAAGESVLGNFIADAQRAAMSTDFAFMNPGGIRADLDAGTVTWGELFTIQPFGNTLVRMTLTGAQISALLEQQWQAGTSKMLQISGLTYTWDSTLPVGSRIISVENGGAPIDPTASYSITTNNFLAAGGDGFTVFTHGASIGGGPSDLDALIAYVESIVNPFSTPAGGRITRLD